MRPHTLVTPKPLLKIAGKSIVHRIVEDIQQSLPHKIEEIHFVIGRFGQEVERELKNLGETLSAKTFLHYQDEPLGTAHAVYCAKEGLNGEIFIAFADTLFVGNFEVSENDDAIIWTKRVDDPSQYGVVVSDGNNIVVSFEEKPQEPVSDKAIIGIYYFARGEELRDVISNMIDNQQLKGGEFQLTDALITLLNSGTEYKCKAIEEWLDCGNKDQFLRSQQSLLLKKGSEYASACGNCKISEPVFIGKNVVLSNCSVGPNVSIGDDCTIEDSKLSNTSVGVNSTIHNSELKDSMIGSFTTIHNTRGRLNIGDFCALDEI